MERKTPTKRISNLVAKIKALNSAYYNDNKSLVTDETYDKAVKKLQRLEAKYPDLVADDSPTLKVGRDSDSFFKKVTHHVPMLSLDNTYTADELQKWVESKASNVPLLVELKADGLALSLWYKHGVLIRAVTRGDGNEGDDVTVNALVVENIPRTLDKPLTCEVRGEICIYKKDFDMINSSNELRGEKVYANPRNLASGTMKLHDPREVSKRKLKFIAYDLIGTNQRYQHEKGIWLTSVGFTVIDSLITNGRLLRRVIKDGLEWKESAKYMADGLVIKINSIEVQQSLGHSSKVVEWAIAYKYPAERVMTKLNSVVYQVGRTGVITPVANLKPVQLCGTRVKRATLHNRSYIETLGLRDGCMVEIEKGGEIIPQVIKASGGTNLITFPTNCPECGEELVQTTEVKIYCKNLSGNCKPQFAQKLAHFASKKALDIEGLGEETCIQLVESGLVSDLSDLFAITSRDLLNLEGFAENSSRKLISGIKACLSKPLDKFLFGLSIPMIGEQTSKVVCKSFTTWYKISKASVSELSSIDGIGNVAADYIHRWFNDERNKDLIKTLKGFGMPKRSIIKEVQKDLPLSGVQVCITGSFGNYSREFLAERVEQLGGEFNKSLKKTTNFLCVGTNVGKNKIEAAHKYKTKILSFDETLNMLKM